MKFDEKYFRERLLLNDSGHVHQIAVRIKELFQGSVLDVGCGCGWVVNHLIDEGMAAIGIDIAEFAVQNRATPHIRKLDFREWEGDCDVIIASKLLQCLDEDEVSEFIEWSLNCGNKHLLILNSPGEGEEYTRSTEYYEQIFTEAGWHLDKIKQNRLIDATGWDCLILARSIEVLDRKPPLSLQSLTTSIVVDCWDLTNPNKLANCFKNQLWFDVELILINAPEKGIVLDKKEPDATLATHYLAGTKLPVVLVEGEFRSISESYWQGVKHSSGSTILFKQYADDIDPGFVTSSVNRLLKSPGHSFVVPNCFLEAKNWDSDWFYSVICPNKKHLQDLITLHWRTMKLCPKEATLYKTPPLTLADLTSCTIPSIGLFRTEDVADCGFEESQQVFGVEDLIFQLLRRGKRGIISKHSISCKCAYSTRFATEEIEEAHKLLF